MNPADWSMSQETAPPAVPGMAQLLAAAPQVQAVPMAAPAPQQPKGFFDNLFSNDPATTMALIAAGARMMHGVAPGQTTGGALADSIMSGMAGYAGVKDNQQTAERQQKELAMKQAESESLVQNRQANTAHTAQLTKSSTELQPSKLEESAAKAKEARLKAAIAEMEHTVAQYEEAQDPTGAKRAEDRKKKLQAALELVQAQTRSANAAAGEHAAGTRLKAEQTDSLAQINKLTGIIADTTGAYTPEEQAKALDTLTTLRNTHTKEGNTSSLVQAAQYEKAQWKLANPKGPSEDPAMYEQRAAKANEEWLRTKKAMSDKEAMQAFLRSSGATTPKEVQNAVQAWKMIQQLTAGEGTTPAPTVPVGAGAPAQRFNMKLNPATGRFEIAQ